MSDPLLDFFAVAMKLKTLKRAGWQRCGVEPCESVADHTFGVALLASLAPFPGIDRNRCIALALVHDLAESIVGDLTPHDPIGAKEKQRREQAAIEQLAATLGDRSIVDFWHEFESGQTPEGRLVRDLDVIEMAIQARAYQQAGKLPADKADEFVDSAARRVQTDAGRKLLERICVRSP